MLQSAKRRLAAALLAAAAWGVSPGAPQARGEAPSELPLQGERLARAAAGGRASGREEATPAAVSRIIAFARGAGEIEVSWEASPSPDVLYYVVYRGEGKDPEPDGEPLESLRSLRFTDTRVVAGAEYRYVVVPVGRDGSHGVPSPVVAVRAEGGEGPKITSILVEPAGRAARPGDVVTVTVLGQSGARATAEVEELAAGIPLTEKGKTGRYTGSFVVRPRDVGPRKTGRRLVVRLTDAFGSSEMAGPILTVIGRDALEDRRPPALARAAHDGWKVAGFSGKLVAGDVLTITAEGEAGALASFDLPGVAEKVPMREVRPGFYTGSYAVRPGAQGSAVQASVRLVDEAGNETRAPAGKPVAFDTRTRLTVSARDSQLPADGKSQTRLTVHAANANGDEVPGHEIAITLAGVEEYAGVVGGSRPAGRGGPADSGERVELRWGGVTDAFGDATALYTAGGTGKTTLIVAKDLTTGDVGVGWVSTYVPAAAPRETPRGAARTARRVVSTRTEAEGLRPIAKPPTLAELQRGQGTLFVPRLYERQERDRLRLVDWLAQPGDKVEKGQPLAVLQSARGDWKLPSPAKGVLVRQAKRAKDRVELGETLGYVEIDADVWKAEYAK